MENEFIRTLGSLVSVVDFWSEKV